MTRAHRPYIQILIDNIHKHIQPSFTWYARRVITAGGGSGWHMQQPLARKVGIDDIRSKRGRWLKKRDLGRKTMLGIPLLIQPKYYLPHWMDVLRSLVDRIRSYQCPIGLGNDVHSHESHNKQLTPW